MSVRLRALSFGALVVGSVIAVDPAGLSPFGPAKWLVISTAAAATVAWTLRCGTARCDRRTWRIWTALLTLLTVSALVNGDANVALLGHPDRHLGGSRGSCSSHCSAPGNNSPTRQPRWPAPPSSRLRVSVGTCCGDGLRPPGGRRRNHPSPPRAVRFGGVPRGGVLPARPGGARTRLRSIAEQTMAMDRSRVCRRRGGCARGLGNAGRVAGNPDHRDRRGRRGAAGASLHRVVRRGVGGRPVGCCTATRRRDHPARAQHVATRRMERGDARDLAASPHRSRARGVSDRLRRGRRRQLRTLISTRRRAPRSRALRTTRREPGRRARSTRTACG